MEINFQEFSQMKEDIAEIKQALLGNEFNGKQGFIFRLMELEKSHDAMQLYVSQEKLRMEIREAREKRYIRLAQSAAAFITVCSFLWGFFMRK